MQTMLTLTSSQLINLPFGSKIKIVWHYSNGYRQAYGIIFGDKIGYSDGFIDNKKVIAEQVCTNECNVYLIKE